MWVRYPRHQRVTVTITGTAVALGAGKVERRLSDGSIPYSRPRYSGCFFRGVVISHRYYHTLENSGKDEVFPEYENTQKGCKHWWGIGWFASICKGERFAYTCKVIKP